jgi:hypothetical protein
LRPTFAMDAKKIDLLIQYALAVASEEDHPFDRQLRPIHLIKYCYLADLAYAKQHEGQSYTETPWQFYNFGPWSRDLFLRLEPAARQIEADERRFSTAHQEDAVSWSLKPGQLRPEELERRLPREVATSIRQAVHEFGSDTPSLLHHVYTTEPMLKAAPGERLELAPEEPEPPPVASAAPSADPSLHPPQLSKTALKKLRRGVQERLQAIREKRASSSAPASAPPPYDEVFLQGQEWLDSLAGEELIGDEGRVSFAESIWKSSGRREPKLP